MIISIFIHRQEFFPETLYLQVLQSPFRDSGFISLGFSFSRLKTPWPLNRQSQQPESMHTAFVKQADNDLVFSVIL
jgi:hypothetical protein